ncbi:ABC transporter [Kitasatospora sp. NPDC052868]|uniref:ABC transporter n=1 Tax=Kitasatospora sp. NPDC052868 TaxID=3364060 RepID=UPI0037C78645
MSRLGALTRYHLELLLRSPGWLPPFLAYALLLVVGVSGGNPLLDDLGYGSAVLLPVTAWYVRCAVTAEPAASRACLVAAAGAFRVQLAALLAAVTAGLVLAAGGTSALWAVGGRVADPGVAAQPPEGPAVLEGLLASVVCVLLGAAVGAVCNRPVLLRPQYGIPTALGLSVLVLAAGASPANAAVRGLITGARSGRVGYPWLELLLAAGLLAAVAAGSSALAGRRPG